MSVVDFWVVRIGCVINSLVGKCNKAIKRFNHLSIKRFPLFLQNHPLSIADRGAGYWWSPDVGFLTKIMKILPFIPTLGFKQNNTDIGTPF